MAMFLSICCRFRPSPLTGSLYGLNTIFSSHFDGKHDPVFDVPRGQAPSHVLLNNDF